MKKSIKIALVDDHLICRVGLNYIFESVPEFKVTLQAVNGDDFINQLLANPEAVDIVLMDMEMPVMGGVETAIRAKAIQPEIKIIYLSGYANVEQIERALFYGASAYVTKDSEADHFIEVIKSVAENGYNFRDYFNLNWNQVNTLKGLNLLCVLSPKEIEVLRLICRELPNREIAERLQISVYTVQTHRQNIMNKTGATRTAGLLKFAFMRGYTEGDELDIND